MNASSTTTERDAQRISIESTCPDWCQDRDNEVHAEDLSLVGSDTATGHMLIHSHTGPSFGPFTCGGETYPLGGPAFHTVDYDLPVCGTADPEVLRQLAADALAAAEWLEARR